MTERAPEPDPEVVELAHHCLDLARAGSAGQLGDLLDAGLPPDLTNSRGDTLLILAAYHAHPETVRLLLAHGADPDRVNDNGQTALGAAVFRRDEQSVRALLEAGADASLGRQSARVTAEFFDLPEMAALLPPASP
ncbi:hypothetical protein EV189_2233 [Motilibacter rhizosphaerae]|uniref:Uncharacterized protein n=1 Tax=Motilibacter rhizosphaerae TaxID=598652 RepID=A0A4V2F494_9ACTN|nr:ankyrin repeat domain-containing protein [Motilibacter rhizosphaerae]RZS86817.1 hypothetical protein EV189_2233 [Motilibacter rhizosphaerae]